MQSRIGGDGLHFGCKDQASSGPRPIYAYPRFDLHVPVRGEVFSRPDSPLAHLWPILLPMSFTRDFAPRGGGDRLSLTVFTSSIIRHKPPLW